MKEVKEIKIGRVLVKIVGDTLCILFDKRHVGTIYSWGEMHIWPDEVRIEEGLDGDLRVISITPNLVGLSAGSNPTRPAIKFRENGGTK